MLAGLIADSEGNRVMDTTVTERFEALDSAFLDSAKRGEALFARFSALACLSSDQSPDRLVESAARVREDLNEGLGMWGTPGKAMRFVFAAALTASDRTAAHFFAIRDALAERRKLRGGRALSHGGSCAALALAASGGQPHHADAYYDMLEAIAAPWWRRDAGREEVLAGILTALGETPEDALAHMERARTALRAAGVPKHHADAAAREICLLDFDAGELAAAWTVLNTAVRGRSSLRHGLGKTGLAILAAQGHGQEIADALVRGFETVRALKPRPSGQIAARLAMRLAQAECGRTQPISAANELAAILAAQAAMVAAVAASSAAVVAAT